MNTLTASAEKPLARRIVILGLVLGAACVLAAVFSGLGYRMDWWHFRTGIQIFKWSFYAAIAAVGLSLIGLAISRKSRSVVVMSVLGILIGGIMVYIPFSWKQTLDAYPYIHDITTDVNDPPQFVAVVALRGPGDHPVTYDGAEVAAQQKQAYPDLQPWNSGAGPEEVFAAATRVIDSMGMEIVASNEGDLHIEATDTTLLYGFKDDMVVRIVETGDGTRVDVRSKSRVGRSDLGQNAKRVRTFLGRLEEELPG
ncbi:MAG TPA: DUF1499 domain-containing protein [Burkholderiales bacterium]|nr:DUF1499 domain-containing protein [Burkholderiales bacterium]